MRNAQLRAFDAQVLVGCGITRADALRTMPASELVQRVESFLSSATGQELLRSATSFEVDRIRNWISEMRRSYTRGRREEVVPIRSERNRERTRRVRRQSNYETGPRIVRSSERTVRDRRMPAVSRSSTATRTSSGTASTQWKFYLDIDSPVVDAPSIGPRMAERLAPLHIITVGDLVAANADSISTQLSDRSVTTEIVRQWQQQALLVCRVPNLRGHDAQLIVGCGLVSAEELAASDPVALLGKVVRFASSKLGVRILRGSNAPDQEEVSDWIQWAQNCRAVRAA